jgi:hypothetical protein
VKDGRQFAAHPDTVVPSRGSFPGVSRYVHTGVIANDRIRHGIQALAMRGVGEAVIRLRDARNRWEAVQGKCARVTSALV